MEKILDGKKIAAQIKSGIASEIRKIRESGARVPGLALILVGDNPSSKAYVEAKAAEAAEVGIAARIYSFAGDVAEKTLTEKIETLNADRNVDGILVQLPLPKHINEEKVITAIDPQKDVDGFHPRNVAALQMGVAGILPCTPKGIMSLLGAYNIPVEGKNAVVVGRSNIVGFPMSKILLDHNATVTIAHSHTLNLGEVTRRADILVVAVGKHYLITADMIKPGAVVIDVGINRNPVTGKLQGDTDFEACRKMAGAITPVPGGVGPLTKASLLENTLQAYLDRENPKR